MILDQNIISGAQTQHVYARQIESSINTVISNCERLDVLVSKVSAIGGVRENWKIKVDQMKADVRSLQSDFSRFQYRNWNRERELSDRDQLLSMRFTTNAEAAKANGLSTSGNGTGDESTAILIEKALDHQNSLNNSNREVDNLLNYGSEMLSSLRSQRDTIKGFRRKMLDVANVLGMSNTVMRLIEKRSEGDKWVLIGGMALTCGVMYFFIRWFT